tara:strand:+ start:1268 stop:2077 length:810 start_codon:yes stop_codon:yes gene_type:complete
MSKNINEDISLLIIVPTLNSYKILPSLTKSLQSQTWHNWRVIFVDGNSSNEHCNWLNNCCSNDPRFTWIKQSKDTKGIYGAMNCGFIQAKKNDWILFWGSDDIAAKSNVFEKVINSMRSENYNFYDLIFCKGRYFNFKNGEKKRLNAFPLSKPLNMVGYRRKLFFGCSPCHQASIIGPGARKILNCYSEKLRLAADLDYFLKLSKHDIHINLLNFELVHMSDGGISGKETKLRIKEVILCYKNSFGALWLFPFISRYLRRIIRLINYEY